MNKEELRIGNVTDKGIVKNFYESGIHVGNGKCFAFHEVNPVDITKDWLIKAGFYYRTPYGLPSLRLKDNSYMYAQRESENTPFRISVAVEGENEEGLIDEFCLELDIIYVDQLQNFYFSVTGEELTLTETPCPEKE